MSKNKFKKSVQDTKERREAILEILKEKGPIYQKALVMEMNENYKNEKNKNQYFCQCTISRDLKRLVEGKKVRVDDAQYSLIPQEILDREKRELSEILRLYFKHIYKDEIGFFVIKNAPNASGLIAQQIKKVYGEEVIGSIQGDDFTLILTPNNELSKGIAEDIKKLVPTK